MFTVRAFSGRLLTVLSCLGLVAALGVTAGAMQGTDKTIFVSVVDAGNKPVADMTAADFAIREDGTQDREIVSAKLSTQAPQIAILVDTTGGAEEYIHDIRTGLKAFVQDVLAKNPESQISLWEFGQASLRIQDFTKDPAVLDRQVGRIFPKPRSGSVLLEALYDSSESLAKRPSQNRVIVALNLEPGDEQSSQEPKKINDSLMKSRAQLWSLSVQKGNLKDPKRDLVLNQLVRNAGGQREYILTHSAIESYMRRFAAAISNQYELTYKRPSGKAQIVQTGSRRPGVKAIAGIFAPQ